MKWEYLPTMCGILKGVREHLSSVEPASVWLGANSGFRRWRFAPREVRKANQKSPQVRIQDNCSRAAFSGAQRAAADSDIQERATYSARSRRLSQREGDLVIFVCGFGLHGRIPLEAVHYYRCEFAAVIADGFRRFQGWAPCCLR